MTLLTILVIIMALTIPCRIASALNDVYIYIRYTLTQLGSLLKSAVSTYFDNHYDQVKVYEHNCSVNQSSMYSEHSQAQSCTLN